MFDVCQSYIDYKDHIVFGIRSNLYNGRKVWIIRTIKPICDLHKVLTDIHNRRENQGNRDLDIINDKDFNMIDGERFYV
jgi:hypothetical protein